MRRWLVHFTFSLLAASFCAELLAQEPYEPISALKSRLVLAKSDSLRGSIYFIMSNTYLEDNLLDSSLWAAKKAKDIANDHDLPLLRAWANHMIGSYSYYEGYYDEGIKIETDVLKEAERLRNPILTANAKKMIGWMYAEIGKEKEAMVLFKESLPIFKKYYQQDIQMNIGLAYYGIGTCHYYLGSYDSARVYYDSAIAARPSLDSRETALILADRAAILRDHTDQINRALSDASRAVALLKPFPKQSDASAYVQAELALTYAKKGQLKEAEYWATSSYSLYDKIPLVKRYVSVYKTLSATFSLAGNFKRAFEMEQQMRTLEDSIYKWRKLHVIEDLKVKYETDKKNQEIASLNFDRIQRESLLIKNQTALLIVACLFALGIGLAYLYYQKREKYHKQIHALEAAQHVRMEKERIAKDLHDSLGSKLSTISLSLQRAMGESGKESLPAIQELTDKTMNELRDSIWAMNQDAISIDELEQRINTLFWQYRKMNHPMEFEMNVTGNVDRVQLSTDDGIHLFRIVQEAVQNSVKHSQASHVRVTLTKSHKRVKLSIRDNGLGFHWPAATSEEHFGLSNMQKRALAIRADFTIDTAPGQGTSISVDVPVNSAS